jgi:peptide/nickel transport system substrate-binding protein
MTTPTEHPHLPRLKREYAEGRMERREFLRLATLLGLSASAAYAFAARISGEAVVPSASAALPRGGTIRVGMKVYEIKQPHVFIFNEQPTLTGQVVEYLCRTGHDNLTRPWLLERWDASADLRTWKLSVRKNVKWRSGREFTADDVIWNLKRVLDEKTGSSVLGLMQDYLLQEYTEGGTKRTRLWDANAIERVDSHTVRLNLKEPQLAIPEHLYHYPLQMLDPAEGGTFGVGSDGTGPFELVIHAVEKGATLRARKGYWGSGPNIDTLEFVDLGNNPAAALGALASRQVHGIFRADSDSYDALKQLPHLEFYSVPTASTAVVRGKCTRKPFNDVRVRRALRLATDPGPVVKLALLGLGVEGEHHHVSPIHPEYAPLPKMKRDVAAARQLLAEAGYPTGVDFEITVRDTAWVKLGVQAMVEQWLEANIRAKINVVAQQLWGEVWNKAPVTFTTWSHRPLGVMTLALAYRTGVPWNESEYSNPEFDRLLVQAEGTLDLEKRRAIVAQLEKIMQEDGPITLPMWRSEFTFFDRRVKGFKMHPSAFIFGEELAVEA